MFYILSGRGKINEGEKAPLMLGEETYFGASSMFLEEPKRDSAFAVADDTRLVAITGDNFAIIVRGHPMIVFNVVKDIVFAMKAKR